MGKIIAAAIAAILVAAWLGLTLSANKDEVAAT